MGRHNDLRFALKISPRSVDIVLTTLVVALLLTTAAVADTLTGTVKNGTNGKAAAGDEVILLNLSQGMEEAGHTKTDAKGNFHFDIPDNGSPHLVRVVHQGVTYHRMAPPGTTSVEAMVFDVAKKVKDISVTADVMRVQAESGNLEIIRLFAVNNTSKPPVTQMNDQNFEFYLPEGAAVDQAMARTAGGQPITATAVPQKEKNRYAFIFPLRPGETQFQISYHVPYSGEATLDPKSLYPLEHFVVMLPKSMQFSGVAADAFQSMQDPEQSEATVQVSQKAKPGQSLAFKVSGSGVLPSKDETPGGGRQAIGGAQVAGAQGGARDSRPGGGLGPPIDAPDPLEKYRWYILGGFGVVLAGGAFYLAKRSPAQQTAGSAPSIEDDETVEVRRAPVAAAATAGPPRSGMLMEALKDELFQLEVERQQGHISQEDYEKHKAALDQTLQRAIKRQSASS
jgi:hypothetical protein